MKAAELTSIFIWIIHRPNELPVSLLVMNDAHNWRIILDDAAAHEYALVWIVGEGPLRFGKLVVVDVVHHSSGEQVVFI